jgi:hypothetical protein
MSLGSDMGGYQISSREGLASCFRRSLDYQIPVDIKDKNQSIAVSGVEVHGVVE